MNSLKSILVMFLCAALILCLGYLGIVETGRQILKGESLPEQAEYENVGSNIFYGKIDDDVEIFPWNYYAKAQENLEKGIPDLLVEEVVSAQYRMLDYTTEEDRVTAMDGYFGQLISYEAEVDLAEVMEWFEENNKHIYYNMSVAREASTGDIYFYQEIMELGGRNYQVQIACGELTPMSFSCIAYDSADRREQEEWKKGKEKMVSVLEQSEQPLLEYFLYMADLSYMPAVTFNVIDDTYGTYQNPYIQGFYWLDAMTQKRIESEELAEIIKEWRLNRENETWREKIISDEAIEETPSYTYQVMDLRDRILIHFYE